jgi:hypothetical protein
MAKIHIGRWVALACTAVLIGGALLVGMNWERSGLGTCLTPGVSHRLLSRAPSVP